MCVSRMLERPRCPVAEPAEGVDLALAGPGHSPPASAHLLAAIGPLWARVGPVSEVWSFWGGVRTLLAAGFPDHVSILRIFPRPVQPLIF